MLKLIVPLFALLLTSCGATGPHIDPYPDANYCHPCCSSLPCNIPCTDCAPAACQKRLDGQLCCTAALRVPPDGGSLCPRP